jgi:predicted metal-dependent hydrolase
MDPDYDKFLHNEIFVHERWVRHLRNQGRFDEAAQLLQAADRRHPHMPVLAQAFRQTRDDMNESHVAKSQRAE